MNNKISEWQASGEYIPYGPFGHQVFVKSIGSQTASPEKTLLLIHGFPESSFSYHKIVDAMTTRFDRIILFDMLGYGHSDKPTEHYTYSLFEQADVLFTVWKYFGIKGGHMLSHDMGDSVATEIVARHVNSLRPIWFSEGLQSITFTNGSMVLDLADLRITQKLLLSRLGPYMKGMVNYKLFYQQVTSAHGNDNLTDQDIEDLWTLNSLQNGQRKTYLTIKYLNDRKRFEKTRWLPALSKCDVPIHICWGEDDRVARIEMAHYLKEKICPLAQLTPMKDVGHFCQIGSPEKWVNSVLAFYNK